MSYYKKYLKYKYKYINTRNSQTGGKYSCHPKNNFANICLEENDGKYKSKDSCINDCEGLHIRNELEKVKIFGETSQFYKFIKDIIANEKMKVYLKGGNVLGLQILVMMHDKLRNKPEEFIKCFDEFLKLDLIKDWDFSGYTSKPITDEYRGDLDRIAKKYHLHPRAKTFILYQTKKPILLDDKPLFEISIMDNEGFSKLEIPLTTMKMQVNEYNLKYVFMFCKQFYAYKLEKDQFDFDMLDRLISKIRIIIHPHSKGLYEVNKDFDKGKLNDKLIDFINKFKKYDENLPQFLATHIEDPYRMLYRLVEKNIKKNNKIKDFLKDNLNITKVDWLFDEKWIRKMITEFITQLGDKLEEIYKDNSKTKNSYDSLLEVEKFLSVLSFNRIKSDYDILGEDGKNLLKLLFGKLVKLINKDDLEISDNNKFINFIKFLQTKL